MPLPVVSGRFAGGEGLYGLRGVQIFAAMKSHDAQRLGLIDQHAGLAGALAVILHAPVGSIADATCLANHQVGGVQAVLQQLLLGQGLAVGILNHVVEVEELEDFTLQMAHHISEKAPLAIAVIKEELRVLGEAHTMNSDEFERIQGMRRAVYDSEDYQEGMNAFLEKRKPNFVGH